MKLSGRAAAFLERLGQHVIKPGLAPIGVLLDALGTPERSFSSILVAGTNGKGSCAAMLHSVLVEAGVRAGLYTSPHLVEVTERIRVERTDIPHTRLSELLERIEDVSNALAAQGTLDRSPTYFEVLTAAAFLHFKTEACRVAVLEVGMGGRFDATNIVQPILSIITPIDFDHEEFLGGTLAKIAAEKAGIMRPGVPVISAAQAKEAGAELSRRAQAIGAPIVFSPGPMAHRATSAGRYETRRSLSTSWITLPLAGVHQVSNASLVLQACEHLRRYGIDAAAEKRGIENCAWPGRLEQVGSSPDVYLDGCHNAAGAATLRAFVLATPNRPRLLVFGCMKDKNVRAMAEVLFPVFDAVVITSVGSARAAAPEQIASITADIRVPTMIEADLSRVVGPDGEWRYERHPLPAEGLAVIAGSLYLVGLAKRIVSRV
ncbi:MAG: bifunctional folylpolyglutamate synthase/dihydrofolate synthase [Acidobacteria bacterium]|nr:bifunctional folylpolyglutamate synthase/dihydrofolate synthase [Acidobacteriota bacterium]